MVISTKTIVFQGLGVVQHFPVAVQLFPGGIPMQTSIETHITCDCAAAQTVFIVELADLISKRAKIWSRSIQRITADF